MHQGSHHCHNGVYKGQRIDKVEMVDAHHDLVGKDDASPRSYVHQDVQDSLHLAACQACHRLLDVRISNKK